MVFRGEGGRSCSGLVQGCDAESSFEVSLYAGGMTVRDIQAHLARTLGTELSHDTISKITDAVLEEVKAWQSRPLESCTRSCTWMRSW